MVLWRNQLVCEIVNDHRQICVTYQIVFSILPSQTMKLAKSSDKKLIHCKYYYTRTTYEHDASRRVVPVRIAHVGRPCGAEMSEISQGSRTTTVESSMKSEHSLYLACEDFPQCASAAFSIRLCKTRMMRRTSCIALPILDCHEVPFFLVLHIGRLGILAHPVSS